MSIFEEKTRIFAQILCQDGKEAASRMKNGHFTDGLKCERPFGMKNGNFTDENDGEASRSGALRSIFHGRAYAVAAPKSPRL